MVYHLFSGYRCSLGWQCPLSSREIVYFRYVAAAASARDQIYAISASTSQTRESHRLELVLARKQLGDPPSPFEDIPLR